MSGNRERERDGTERNIKTFVLCCFFLLNEKNIEIICIKRENHNPTPNMNWNGYPSFIHIPLPAPTDDDGLENQNWNSVRFLIE
jgi:hypothetical protein